MYTLLCHRTWRAGKWTIETVHFPIETTMKLVDFQLPRWSTGGYVNHVESMTANWGTIYMFNNFIECKKNEFHFGRRTFTAHSRLVGGLEHGFYFPYIGSN